MTEHERQRFASLPACDCCEHPAGHHTRRGCAWCDCAETPSFARAHPGTIYETAAGGIYRTADDYLVTPAALLAMGVRVETRSRRWCSGATTPRDCRTSPTACCGSGRRK